MMRAIHNATLAGLLFAATADAADWPGWRGPTGQGLCEERDLPLSWNGKTGENIAWKVRLPGTEGKARPDHNQSSPIVCRGRVFLTSCYWPDGVETREHPTHVLSCYRLQDGKKLWDTVIEPGPWKLTDLRGGYAAPSPASDGERVYVAFGSSVLAAVDWQGKTVWRREIVPFDFDVAFASSPVLYGATVILQCDGLRKSSRLVAFDRRTGETRWEQKRPTVGFSHSTPVIARIADRAQLVVAASDALQGTDPDSGKILWWCQGRGDTSSPVLAAGLAYLDSGRGGAGIAVDPSGNGDVTRTHLRWKDEKVPEGFSSPVAAGPWLYRLHNPGMLRCWKAVDGTLVFDQRLEGVSTASSPIVTADNRFYAASGGRSYVLRVGAQPEILARNDLEDPSPASPAISDGCILLRGHNYLYCIRKAE